MAVRAVASGSGPHLRTEPRRAVGRADRRPRPQPSPRRPATAPDPVRTLGAAAGVVFAAACARRALRRGGVVAHPVAATVASHARAGHHETTWGLASRPSPRPPATAATHCCPGGLDRPRRGRSCGGLRATQALRHTTNTRNPARRRRSDDFNWPSAPTARSGSWPPRCLPRSAGSQPDRPPGPRPLTASGDLAQRGRPRADGGPVAHARRRVGAVPGRRGVRSAGCCCVRSRPRRPDGSRLCGRTGLPWFRQWRRSRSVSGVVGGPFTRLRSPDRSGVSWDPWAG